jgi:hypothetical protein
VLAVVMGQDLGHSIGPMAFMPSAARAAGDATEGDASRRAGRVLTPPSDGTDGCGSMRHVMRQYTQSP